jgi:hypothetical protein
MRMSNCLITNFTNYKFCQIPKLMREAPLTCLHWDSRSSLWSLVIRLFRVGILFKFNLCWLQIKYLISLILISHIIFHAASSIRIIVLSDEDRRETGSLSKTFYASAPRFKIFFQCDYQRKNINTTRFRLILKPLLLIHIVSCTFFST